ncbi:MAG: epoxyqueuosine reductase QueH [Ruminococcaceae bacterium]|nr:epoxyqueuosine reductase QueH [Oscillospiraceae bacterium]
MMKRNYQKELEGILEGILESPPSLLLHSCCAPCSSYVLEYLSQFFRITVLFYNPNMDSEEEFLLRSKEQIRLIEEMKTKNVVECVIVPYEAKAFYDVVKGLEKEPEGGRRCEKCFALRLRKTAEYAARNQFDWFTTTLTISPLKNAPLLNEIGEQMGKEYGVSFLPSDFKKKGGYLRSTQLSREYGLYRQDYCGCVFSKQTDREKGRNILSK